MARVDTTNPRQERELKQLQGRIYERLLNDTRVVLASPEGRRFLGHLLAFADLSRGQYDPSAKLHFNMGQQAVAAELRKLVCDAKADADLDIDREVRALHRKDDDVRASILATTSGRGETLDDM